MMAREGNDEVADIPGEEDGEQPSGDENDAALALEAVEKLGQPAPPPAAGDGIHCLTIIGQVEGHVLLPPKAKTTKYEHVIPQLVAVEQNPDVKGLLIILNTVGGDIEAGLAIAEMIKSLSKPKVSLILGGGHSIGGPIAVAADRSFIAGTATVTIHPIRLSGLVIGVPQTYEYLDKMQDRVVKFIVENSSIGERHFRELMFRTGELMRDVGTVLVGEEAVRVGLIDEIGGIAQAFAYLRDRIHGRPHVPQDALLPNGGAHESKETHGAQEGREIPKTSGAERSPEKPFVPSVDPVIPTTVEPPHDDPGGDRPW